MRICEFAEENAIFALLAGGGMGLAEVLARTFVAQRVGHMESGPSISRQNIK
ncbi:MAG: hypothetical protein JOZ52_09240 [Acidobacteria bacterium]|nr:hypothetical protein [Acidobacteriota bacterium]